MSKVFNLDTNVNRSAVAVTPREICPVLHLTPLIINTSSLHTSSSQLKGRTLHTNSGQLKGRTHQIRANSGYSHSTQDASPIHNTPEGCNY